VELQLPVNVGRVAPDVVHLRVEQFRHVQVVDVNGFFFARLGVDVVGGRQKIVVQLALQTDQLGVNVTDFAVQSRQPGLEMVT